MCGFAGVLFREDTDVSKEQIRGFLARLAHRGPDDQGYLVLGDRGVEISSEPRDFSRVRLLLLHRRLSILELSKAGWQPMQSEEGRYSIVFNGEIYNYLELRRELQALGIPFHSGSDTEVLLKACARWGREALRRFVGMFAFAMVDARERKLTLARDFFGIKPLYTARFDGGLAFASEIKALLGLPGLRRRVQPERLYTYLRYGISDFGDRTFFEGISQIPAGHAVDLSLDGPGNPVPEPYWQPPAERRGTGLTFEQAAEELRHRFLESVRWHLRSDVPIGSALSGGIDSSAIVMAMRHLDRGAQLHAFSYVAEDPGASEEKWIDLVSTAAGATLHKVRLGPADLTSDLDVIAATQDEPFVSSSIYAQYRVFKAARDAGIKVLLDGQGADELLAGYDQYLGHRAATLVRQGRWRDARRLLKNRKGYHRLGELLTPPAAQGLLRALAGEQLMPSWLNGRWFQERGVSGRALREKVDDPSMTGELHRSMTRTTLPMLLRFEDRNSMAHSLESRVPFLTPSLAEFLASLPEEYLISSDGTSKAVFRRALRGIVPDEVLDRRDKIGFETPQNRWLLESKPKPEDGEARLNGVLAADAVPRLRDRLSRGDAKAGPPLWRCLNLAIWARIYDVDFGA